MMQGKNILLVISGGIAAYKMLDFIRRVRERGAIVRTILTKGGAEFVTPLSIASLSEEKVYQDLFSLTDEQEMGHIKLARWADLILVAPASANMIAKMVEGKADDLATTCLLAASVPVMVAPAMNVKMWAHDAVQDNMRVLKSRGVLVMDPGVGDMACGETGAGRLVEVDDMVARVERFFAPKKLMGKKILVTAGPTYEPIDPVRFLGNYSSGKQGYAIAVSLQQEGAEVILISGPTSLPDPAGVQTIRVQTAQDMLQACKKNLPVDVAICAAAVADWRVDQKQSQKIKKTKRNAPPTLELVENPDILSTLAQAKKNRPRLVIGFAAESNDVKTQAQEKLHRKKCDWILANDIKNGAVFGDEMNKVHFIARDRLESWPKMRKEEVAEKLTTKIIQSLGEAV